METQIRVIKKWDHVWKGYTYTVRELRKPFQTWEVGDNVLTPKNAHYNFDNFKKIMEDALEAFNKSVIDYAIFERGPVESLPG